MNLHGPVRAPAEIGLGTATAAISFDAWKDGGVLPSEAEITIEAVPPLDFALLPVSKRLKPVQLMHPSKEGTESISSIAFSPDGSRIIAGSYTSGIIQTWDAGSGKQLLRFEARAGNLGYFNISPDWTTLYGVIHGLSERERIERDGKKLETWKFDDYIQAWSMVDGAKVTRWEHDPRSEVFSARLSPDGALVLSSEQLPGTWENFEQLRHGLWDIASGKFRELPRKTDWSTFSLDGRMLVGAQYDDEYRYNKALTVLDTQTLSQRLLIPNEREFAWIKAYAFSPDGKHLAGYVQAFPGDRDFSSFRCWLKLWDEQGREVMSIEAEHEQTWLTPRWFSPDGRTLAAISKSKGGKHSSNLLLFDVPSRSLRHRIEFKIGDEYASPWEPVLSPDGRIIAIPSQTRLKSASDPDSDPTYEEFPQPRIHLIEMASGRIVETLVAPQCYMNALAFSPDGRTLASSGPGKVLLWDVVDIVEAETQSPKDEGKDDKTGDEGEEREAEDPADERPAVEDAEPEDAEPEDAEPEDAEPEDAEPEDAEPEDDEEPLVEFELLPVSKRLKPVELIHPAKGDPESLAKIQFSPDGKRLIAGGYPSGIVRMWDVASGKPLTTIECGEGSRSGGAYFDVSPDWKTMYAANNDRGNVELIMRDGKTIRRWKFDGCIHAWSLTTGSIVETFENTPRHGVMHSRLSPEGKWLLCSERLPGEWDYEGGRGNFANAIWNVATKEYRRLPEDMETGGPFLADGKTKICTLRDGRSTTAILYLDLATLRVKRSLPIVEKLSEANVWSVSPDGKFLAGNLQTFSDESNYATFRSPFTIWEAETGRVVTSVTSHLKNCWFYPSEFSADGKTIALTQFWMPGLGDFGAKLFLVDVASGAIRHEIALHDGDKRAHPGFAVFSPDGKLVVVASRIVPDALRHKSRQGLIRLKAADLPQPRFQLIDVASGRVVETIVSPQCTPNKLVFSPDGKTLATSGHHRVLLWDVSDLAGK